MQSLSTPLNIIGKYQSVGNPVMAMEMNRKRQLILAGHNKFISLLQVTRAPDENMFKHKFTFQTQNLKQLSWNKLMDEKIAVASERKLIIYDMEKPESHQEFSESYYLSNRQRKGDIHHIQWMNNHANVMLVAEGNVFRIWDLRTGANNNGSLQFFNELQFDQINSKFKVNLNDTMVGSFSSDGYVKLFDLRKLGHSQFSHPLYSILVPFVSAFDFDPINSNMFMACGNQQLGLYELIGDRANLKTTLHSIIDSQYIVRSVNNPDLIYSFGQKKIEQQNFQMQVHGFNIQHKGRPQRYYNLGNMNKVLGFHFAQSTELLITHQKQKIMGFSTEPYQNFYRYAPHNPVLLDDQSHHIIYNLQQQSDIRKRYHKKYSKPVIYLNQPSIANKQNMSFKDQLIYLHEQYKIMGHLEDISFQNASIAKKYDKNLCQDMWNNLPMLLSMENDQSQEQSIDKNKQNDSPSMIETLLQDAIDQGQLPTVVYYSIVVQQHNPNILRKSFITNIFAAYLQILRRFSLFYIAARICIDSKTEQIIRNTKRNTIAKVICTRCKKKIPQNQSSCKTAGCCEVVCFCKLPLKSLILWCQGCQHGFHVDEAIQWFTITDECPYACGHKCYKILQKDMEKILTLQKSKICGQNSQF